MLNYEQIKELKTMGFSNADILAICGTKPQEPEKKPQEPEKKPQEPEKKPQEPEKKPQEAEKLVNDNAAILAAIRQLTGVIQANAIMTAQNQKDTGPKIEDVVASIIEP